MTAALTYRHPPSKLGRLAATSLLASALLLSWALVAPISPARAGEWIQRSCAFEGENIGYEGWEAKAYYGYPELPSEGCGKTADDFGLDVYATPLQGDEDFAGQAWIYKPPTGSTIAGGEVDARLIARNGFAQVVAIVAERPVSKTCEHSTCESPFEGKVPVPAGASEVYVRAGCFAATESPHICHTPEMPEDGWWSPFSAEAGILSAEFDFTSKAAPKASGFSGTLLNETLSGAGTLSFTATDAGPGIYQARVKIDGGQVWAGMPNENEGKCVPAGTAAGVRIFDSPQPCPTEAVVHSEIHTVDLADGLHTVTVELEDAAGNVSTVYSGTVITANHPASTPVSTPPAPVSVSVFSPTTATAPPERGPCNGTPCDEAAKVIADAGEAKTFTRPFGRSGLTLSGRLTSSSGSPIKDAQVKLLQQITGSTATTQVADTTTAADGSWTLQVPAGPSRLLSVAFYSHTLDVTPASVLDFHERVQGAVSMHAPHRAHLGRAITFTGQLAGGNVPAGGESVQMEIFYGARWRTIEVLPTDSQGRWRYKYVFTLGVGASYRFRVVTVPNGGYPYTVAGSRPVRVTVKR